MAELGIVKGSEVTQNLDGDKKSRVLQVQLANEDDVQSVELYRLPGDDQNPADDTRVLVITIGTSLAAVSAADVEADDTLEKGEREIYSTDGAQRLAKIRLKADGSIVANDGEDWAVRYSALEAAFQDLQDTVNDFLSQYVPGGPAAVGTPATGVVLPSTGDITKTKVESVRLP
jgi:hypothetical protein